MAGFEQVERAPQSVAIRGMPHHGKCVVLAEQEFVEASSEVLGLGHAPCVASGSDSGHHRRVERPGLAGADDQRACPGNVLGSDDTKEPNEIGAGHGPHQPAQECVDHCASRWWATSRSMRSTTWSTSSLSVSMTTASEAGRRGATARFVSTRSLSSTSVRMASWSTFSPRRSYWAALRRTFSSRLAVRKNLWSASGNTTV